MKDGKAESHLDVYENRYELHRGRKIAVYYQGVQNEAAKRRYTLINRTLSAGYLDEKLKAVPDADFSGLSERGRLLLRNMVDGITSETGRALAGLTFLQLTIKSISPEQNVRLHKGASKGSSFSWKEGISMRTIDSLHTTPFLRKHALLKLNKYGLFTTRSLAENYPYSGLYKAEMRGPFQDWTAIVDALEDGRMPAGPGLCYMMALLQNRSEKFREQAERACGLAAGYKGETFPAIQKTITAFFNTTDYSARAFEVAMHALFQAMAKLRLLGNADLVPMSQMRSANKKHGNVADIELSENDMVVEAWDAKYGKPYLRDELEELREKLLKHPDVKIAGFVVDSPVDMRKDIETRKNEIEEESGVKILLLSFDEWINRETASLSDLRKKELAYEWLVAVVESFAQKRPEMAPIDEPCDAWIDDWIKIMKNRQGEKEP